MSRMSKTVSLALISSSLFLSSCGRSKPPTPKKIPRTHVDCPDFGELGGPENGTPPGTRLYATVGSPAESTVVEKQGGDPPLFGLPHRYSRGSISSDRSTGGSSSSGGFGGSASSAGS